MKIPPPTNTPAIRVSTFYYRIYQGRLIVTSLEIMV